MATNFDDETYGQRWQVETVMLMIKRHQGEHVGWQHAQRIPPLPDSLPPSLQLLRLLVDP